MRSGQILSKNSLLANDETRFKPSSNNVLKQEPFLDVAVQLQKRLNSTTSVAYIDPTPYAAIFFPGMPDPLPWSLFR